MPETRSTIITLTTDDQLHEAAAVHHAVHGDPEPVWEEFLFPHPRWAAPGAHRAILADDRIVALTTVARWQHRFGDSELPVGEIGLVGTLPAHRNHGHSRSLMESWLVTLRAQRVPLAYLVGIPGFYERWGFHYAAPDHANHFVSIGKDALTRCAVPGGITRGADADRDIPGIRELIATEMRNTPGSPVLDETMLRFFLERADAHGVDWHVVEDASGAIVGVVRMKRWVGGTGPQAPGAVTLVAARDDDARAAIAAVMLDHLGDRAVAQLPLAIAPHGPFATWLFLRGASRRSDCSIYPGGYAAMYRVNDLSVVLGALRSGWNEQELVSRFSGTAITLRAGAEHTQASTIEVTPDALKIHHGGGGIEIDAPPAVAVPWVTGWRSAADWLDGTSFPPMPGPAFDPGDPDRLSPNTRDLLRALFPVRHPYIGDTTQSA